MKIHQNLSLYGHFSFKFQTNLLALRHRELRLLGLKFGQVLTLLTVSTYAVLLKIQSGDSFDIVKNILHVVFYVLNTIVLMFLNFSTWT